jgi:hypothetical protein
VAPNAQLPKLRTEYITSSSKACKNLTWTLERKLVTGFWIAAGNTFAEFLSTNLSKIVLHLNQPAGLYTYKLSALNYHYGEIHSATDFDQKELIIEARICGNEVITVNQTKQTVYLNKTALPQHKVNITDWFSIDIEDCGITTYNLLDENGYLITALNKTLAIANAMQPEI